MMVIFIIFQHADDSVLRQLHADVEIDGNVPRAVVLMCSVAWNFRLQIFDIVNAGQNH